MAVKQFQIRAAGKVQGVWYRQRTMETARKLNLTGFVRNEADGSVYIEAQGEKDQIMKLIAWCRQGPEAAEVERVEWKEAGIKKFSSFDIIR